MASTIDFSNDYIRAVSHVSNLEWLEKTGAKMIVLSVNIDSAAVPSDLTIYSVPENKTLLVHSITSSHESSGDDIRVFDNTGNTASGVSPYTCFGYHNGIQKVFPVPLVFTKGITVKSSDAAASKDLTYLIQGYLV